MSSLWTAFNVFTNAIYLSLIILTVPLAFDVGGEECGLAFTLTLVTFYSLLATIRLLGRHTKFNSITQIIYYSQHVIIPSLFILFLNIYSTPDISYSPWSRTIEPWGFFLKNATPTFTILEGFCTLLVIQAIGQISRWLVNNKSDSWLFILLIVSAGIITGGFYFLYRIYVFPIDIGSIDATLIGVVLTCTVFLGAYGVATGKGNLLETCLLFAYIVYNLYETFTDFQPTIEINVKAEFPPFPPIIMESYASLMSSLAAGVPASFSTTFGFINAAMSTITPSIFVSLAYRLLVLFAATQIIPVIRQSSRPIEPRNTNNNVNESDDSSLTSVQFVTAYAPCVLIAVYSHLLMHHFGYLPKTTNVNGVDVNTWQLWSWANAFVILILYASEVVYGKESKGESLTRHWKV
ncbi:ICE2-domain-containing protein, partial [Lipomyces japonicus]|uniref:ICE2-domain-containing protein n=1 Tax=Lipomyces japonicus TaxID=56871 RepID=UPI0034CE2AEA